MLGEPLLGHDGEAPDVGLVSGHHLGERYQLRLPSEHDTAGMYVNMLSAVQGNVVPLGAQLQGEAEMARYKELTPAPGRSTRTIPICPPDVEQCEEISLRRGELLVHLVRLLTLIPCSGRLKHIF